MILSKNVLLDIFFIFAKEQYIIFDLLKVSLMYKINRIFVHKI